MNDTRTESGGIVWDLSFCSVEEISPVLLLLLLLLLLLYIFMPHVLTIKIHDPNSQIYYKLKRNFLMFKILFDYNFTK